MVLSELLAKLRADGLNAQAHQLHHAIAAGYLPRPPRDGSGRYRFAPADVRRAAAYLRNVPRPGRKKAVTTSTSEGAAHGLEKSR